ncbi:hypothetical protein ACH4LT_19160 [Streptomyces clavifer]
MQRTGLGQAACGAVEAMWTAQSAVGEPPSGRAELLGLPGERR